MIRLPGRRDESYRTSLLCPQFIFCVAIVRRSVQETVRTTVREGWWQSFIGHWVTTDPTYDINRLQ